MNTTPWCVECDGQHEPSGARGDCVAYWRQRARSAGESVAMAQTLLCSATPNEKLIGGDAGQEWCLAFGKWFADSHSWINRPRMKDCPSCVRGLTIRGVCQVCGGSGSIRHDEKWVNFNPRLNELS